MATVRTSKLAGIKDGGKLADMEQYDQAAELLKEALDKIQAAGIDSNVVAPLLADFALMAGVVMFGAEGGDALIERMRKQMTALEEGCCGPAAQFLMLRTDRLTIQ